jgi:hypothetical protein
MSCEGPDPPEVVFPCLLSFANLALDDICETAQCLRRCCDGCLICGLVMYTYHERAQAPRLEAAPSLGGISQITIDKDEADTFDFADSTFELRKRLEELEEITLSFLAERCLCFESLLDLAVDLFS